MPGLPDHRRTKAADLLAAAKQRLATAPTEAVDLARRALDAAPGGVEARFVLAAGLRRACDPLAALSILAPLLQAHPSLWGLHYEAGMAQAALGRCEAAATALRRAAELNPQSALAWHALGDQLAMLGDPAALAAHSRPVVGGVADPIVNQAAGALFKGDREGARALLADRLNMHLSDLAVVRLLADAGLRMGRFEAVEAFLQEAFKAAPDFIPVGFSLAVVHYRLNRIEEASALVGRMLALRPDNGRFKTLRAAIRMQAGLVAEAIADYEAVLAAQPDEVETRLAYGHALRAIGRSSDAVAAYREVLAAAPNLGEAYWSLANLKTWRFEPDDLKQMSDLLASGALSVQDQAHLNFALGKAHEDDARYGDSFRHYTIGNAARRQLAPYDPVAHADFIRRTISTFSPDFIASRRGVGCELADPIFVLGMPRSGSTLIEQILASHSAVEGASELPDITDIARRLATGGVAAYPTSVADLSSEQFRALGEEYIQRTRGRRTLGRARFVDKFPGNFQHIGLIQLMLPKAKIIDIRRHPLGCCVSLFKQNFADGQLYSYDLGDLGHYYAEYVRLMAHFDVVFPQKILRVNYEALVDQPEAAARRLLDFCELAFEPSCLRFYETQRAVRTPSSEQVRRPIFRDGLDQWRRFEPWLGPLKAALGPVAGVDN